MTFYVVDEERLLREINHQGKGKGKGVLNWFIDSNDNTLNVLFDVFNIKYLYKVPVGAESTILRLELSDKSRISGVVDYSVFEPEEYDGGFIDVNDLREVNL